MAHELEILNGQAQMMYVGDVPWHGLGKRFIEPPTLDEAIVAAGLNWKVTTEPLFAENGEIVNAKLTRRDSDGKQLGVVGPNYEPLQNNKAFDFFRPFIDTKQAMIETAGSLREGKRVFVLAKLALDPLKIKGNDVVEKYIMLSNSHDGTLAVRVGFTPVRIVCANTLAMAHSDVASKLIRIRHTKSVEMSLEQIRETMNLANQEFEASAEQYRLLASKDINQADLEKYVKLVFNTSKKLSEVEGNLDVLSNKRLMNEIVPLFEQGRGNDMLEIKGTYWAAYNAISEYLQYNRGKDKEVRLDNLWFGQGSTINKKALEIATTMATMAA